MVYLSRFVFPTYDAEYDFRLHRVKRTCYNTMYPFFVLSARGLEELSFSPVTILCGGNGSGKTTALNVIAECLHLPRSARFNRSDFFGEYVGMCSHTLAAPLPKGSRILTSDDVFDFMLDVRAVNEGIDRRREELFSAYSEYKYADVQLRTLDDYDRLREACLARSRTQSRYVREHLPDNVRERSNGESALLYFRERIGENVLCLLDEPENSLSPSLQLELKAFLEQSARFFGCQFIMATHSPFLLAVEGAKIYDLDAAPAAVKAWEQLESVRVYYDFFVRSREKFEENGNA